METYILICSQWSRMKCYCQRISPPGNTLFAFVHGDREHNKIIFKIGGCISKLGYPPQNGIIGQYIAF